MPEHESQPYLSIVLPSYNEEERLPPSLQTIVEFLQAKHFQAKDFSWEIVVVDDGSQDRTSEVAEESLAGTPHTVLRNEPNRGKALSVKRGMMESRGQVVLFSDADLSTPIEEADPLLAAIEDGADVAIGSRQMKGSVIELRQPWYRQLGGLAFSVINRVVLLPGIPDSQCGFKAFTREAINRIFPHQQLAGWAFDAEVLFIARRLGLKIAQIPVRWINSPDTRVNMLVDGPKMVRDLFRIRWLHRRLRADSQKSQ